MRTRTLIAATAATLLLAGCSDVDDLGPGSEPSPAEPDETEEVDEETEPEETEEPAEPDESDEPADDLDPDGEEAEGQLLIDLDEPVVWEDAGVRVAVTGVGFTSLDSPVVGDDIIDFLDDDSAQTLVALEVTVSNDAGETVNVYVNQGQVQIGREQVDADLWFSESFAGTMNEGVDDDGLVIFVMSTAFDDLVAEGSLLYEVSGPSSDETFERLADDISITVDW